MRHISTGNFNGHTDRQHQPFQSTSRFLAKGCRRRLTVKPACCSSQARDDKEPSSSNKPFRHPELEGAPGSSSGSSSLVPDALPLMGADTDWREFRARLVAQSSGGMGASSSAAAAAAAPQWCHALPRPEKGCLLLAHPLLFEQSQEYFYRAVILLLDHSDQGSCGVILNRPSSFMISQMGLTHPLPEFDGCKLYVGGDVGGGEITLLHTRPELEGCVELVSGLYMGGIGHAQECVREGKMKPQEFRWFAKYAGWGPGQLEQECKRGVWFTAAASRPVIMAEPQRADGFDTWHSALELMGGDYALLSEQVKAADERASRHKSSRKDAPQQ